MRVWEREEDIRAAARHFFQSPFARLQQPPSSINDDASAVMAFRAIAIALLVALALQLQLAGANRTHTGKTVHLVFSSHLVRTRRDARALNAIQWRSSIKPGPR